VSKRLGEILLAFALIFAIGGHWALLQSVAWVGMFANNVRSCSVGEALEKTFDGEHPCELCKIVQAVRKSEQPQPLTKHEVKIDFWITPATCLLVGPPSAVHARPQAGVFSSRIETPPTPPPRVA